jgi:hypothetical protein
MPPLDLCPLPPQVRVLRANWTQGSDGWFTLWETGTG